MTTLLAGALLLTLQAQPPASQNTKASIEGFVVRAGTNEPIGRARISVFRSAGPGGAVLSQTAPLSSIPSVTSDNRGHFVVKDLDPGSYLLTVQRNGFARQSYGERAPGRPGIPLNVLAGQTLNDIVFRLAPAGAVSGRVSDATGEPLAGITVQLIRPVYDQNGRRTFQTIGTARSNDRGEYRIYWVTPGHYYANATPSRSPIDGLPILPNSNEVVEPGYVVTYYPGTTDASTATAIEVQPGAELSTIDFSLTQPQLFHVRGRVFDARTGQSLRNLSISILPRTPTGNFVFTGTPTNYNPANGTFDLSDVAPGSYWVRGISVPETAGAITSANTAQVALDVSNTDVENIVLTFSAGFSIRGRLDVDGGSLSNIPDFDRIRVGLVSIEQAAMPFFAPQTIKSDGTFTLDSIQPGDYRLNMFPQPPNTYLKSVHLGQVDVSAGVSISGPVSDSLEIILSTKGAQIDGTVVDKDLQPIRGVLAALIPDQQRDRRDLWKTGNTDQNGHFTMRNVAPGDYKLFAWEDIEPGAHNDPDFLRRYEALAMPVKVSESAKVTIEAKVIPAAP